MKLITLTKGQFAMVDDEDFDWLNRFSWKASFLAAGIYATTNVTVSKKQRTLYMHRVIMNETQRNVLIDHKNHNTLDNQRDNLRKCTSRQNQMNRTAKKNGSSRFLGVTFFEKKNTWKTQIKYNGVNRCIGSFEKEEDAAKAYDEAAKIHHGEFANLNFK